VSDGSGGAQRHQIAHGFLDLQSLQRRKAAKEQGVQALDIRPLVRTAGASVGRQADAGEGAELLRGQALPRIGFVHCKEHRLRQVVRCTGQIDGCRPFRFQNMADSVWEDRGRGRLNRVR
jgi:hypothetical protein